MILNLYFETTLKMSGFNILVLLISCVICVSSYSPSRRSDEIDWTRISYANSKKTLFQNKSSGKYSGIIFPDEDSQKDDQNGLYIYGKV